MTSIGGIGLCPWLGSEKSHYVHGWIVVCQKPGVLGWRIHTDCPRLEAITGRAECVCGGTFVTCIHANKIADYGWFWKQSMNSQVYKGGGEHLLYKYDQLCLCKISL